MVKCSAYIFEIIFLNIKLICTKDKVEMQVKTQLQIKVLACKEQAISTGNMIQKIYYLILAHPNSKWSVAKWKLCYGVHYYRMFITRVKLAKDATKAVKFNISIEHYVHKISNTLYCHE